MTSTGAGRKCDDVGRIVIPKKIRDTLEIESEDSMEMFTDEGKIILRKYDPGRKCLITGEVRTDNLIMGDGQVVLSKKGARKLIEILERKNRI